MEVNEFDTFAQNVIDLFSGFEDVLHRSHLAMKGLMDEVVNESFDDAQEAIQLWVKTHPPNRQPTISEIGEAVRSLRLRREKTEHTTSDLESHEDMTTPLPPWHTASEADKAWALFHLRWTGDALARIERRTDFRHVERFPWADLVQEAYAQFAGKWPEYADDCDRAVQSIMAKHPEAFRVKREEEYVEHGAQEGNNVPF